MSSKLLVSEFIYFDQYCQSKIVKSASSSSPKGLSGVDHNWGRVVGPLRKYYPPCLLDSFWHRATNTTKTRFASAQAFALVFWDAQGMLYWQMLSSNQTINAALYTEQLQKLAEAVREKRPNRLEVALLHDNARPHVAKLTRQFLEERQWTTVPHPPYSPDLAPSDYHLFRALKHHLKDKKFENEDEHKNALTEFFDAQLSSFWHTGIEALPIKWLRVVDTEGEYIID